MRLPKVQWKSWRQKNTENVKPNSDKPEKLLATEVTENTERSE
jgi:hypothetical protein